MDFGDVVSESMQMMPRANWKIGHIESALRGAAAAVPLELMSVKTARLELAKAVYGREISSYNELTGGQIHALYAWATTKGLEVKEWLEDRYGRQLSML